MKYLKLYEEYTDIKADDYYQALSMQEFDQLVFDEFLEPKDTLLEFNEMEINQIKKQKKRQYLFNPKPLTIGLLNGKNFAEIGSPDNFLWCFQLSAGFGDDNLFVLARVRWLLPADDVD